MPRVTLRGCLQLIRRNRSRNGTRAVQLAEEALQLSGGRNPLILRTLAAADAESGRFAEAVGTAQRGLEIATKQGNASLANEFQTYILLYPAPGRRCAIQA